MFQLAPIMISTH